MIEINLVPAEKRKKKKSKLLGGFNIPLEIIVGCAGGLVVLLVFAHIFLTFLNLTKHGKHKKLQAQFEEIRPAKESVDTIIYEMRTLQASQKAIKDITKGREIIWAQKLNILSDSLPRGTWLRKVALGEEVFFVEGSAISKQKKEMINVHNFTSTLNKEQDFLKHFQKLELGSIQRRKIKNVEIADFLITATIQNE